MDYQIKINQEQCKLLYGLVKKQLTDIEENIAIDQSFGTDVDPRYQESVRKHFDLLKELHVQLASLLKGRILFDNVVDMLDEFTQINQQKTSKQSVRKLQRYMAVRDMVAYRVYDEYNNGSMQETVTIFTVAFSEDGAVVICDNQITTTKSHVFGSVESVQHYLHTQGYIDTHR